MASTGNKLKAYTLAELMVVTMIVSVIAAATIGIQKSRTDYITKFMYYASIKNIQEVALNIISEGTIIKGSPAIPGTGATYETRWIYDPREFQSAQDLYAAWNNAYWYDLNCRGLDADYGTCDSRASTAAEIAAQQSYLSELDYIKNTGEYELRQLTPGDTNYSDSENYTYQYCTDPGTGGTPATPDQNGKILPASGIDLCKSITEKMNTIGDTPDCSQTGTTTPNFTTTNSIRWFNFGSPPTYIGTTNGYTIGTGTEYGNEVYTVYIDIDGAARGNNTLNTDIMKFYMARDGLTILPAEDSVGANETKYLSSNIRYKNGADYVIALQGIAYRVAVCKAGKVPTAFKTTYGYCDGITSDATTTTCATPGITCEVINNRPGF